MNITPSISFFNLIVVACTRFILPVFHHCWFAQTAQRIVNLAINPLSFLL
jgi:hypothetical protein